MSEVTGDPISLKSQNRKSDLQQKTKYKYLPPGEHAAEHQSEFSQSYLQISGHSLYSGVSLGSLEITDVGGFTHSQALPYGPHEALPEETGKGAEAVSLVEQTWETETATAVQAAYGLAQILFSHLFHRKIKGFLQEKGQ